MGNLRRQTPNLNGWDRLSQGNPRIPHRNLPTSGLLNQLIPLIPYSIRISINSWKLLTTSNHIEDWSDDVDLFMDAMSHSSHMADILWELVKLKKQKGTSKTPEKSSESIFDKPWTKETEGLTPT